MNIMAFIWNTLKSLGRWLTLGIVLLALVWASLFLIFAPDLPETNNLLLQSTGTEVVVLARDGSVLSRTGGGQILIRDLPPHLPQAVLATEDRRFYEHFGMDIIGFARAALANLKAGRVVQGGSTITQQLAKNLWLTPERTFTRKLKELMLAIWLEARLQKQEILTLYLNRVYLGAGSYGVESAARRYFGKSARNVSLSEAALLAGLLKAPSRYAPTNNLNRSRQRAAEVIDNMVEAGYLSENAAAKAKRSPAKLAKSGSPSGGYGYFVDWVETQIPLFIGRVDDGIVVETTLDPLAQRSAEAALSKTLAQHSKKRHVNQGALIAFDTGGGIRAMIGGRSYRKSQYNRAIQAQRQPGSAFKTLVYLAALESGLGPDKKFKDGPINIDGWRPKNFDGKYAGQVTMETALARSINTVAVRIAQAVGPERIIQTARRLGVTSRLSSDLSIALGTSEVSLFEMTAAYLPFANGGIGVYPFGIQRIRSKTGTTLYERSNSSLGRIVESRHVGQMNKMLSTAVTSGTGRKANMKGRAAAGKTGTSQDYRDSWFIGYTADLVAGIWLGNDDNAPTKRVTGGLLPADTWRRFVTAASANTAARSQPTAEIRANTSQSGSLQNFLDEVRGFFSGSASKPANRPQTTNTPSKFENFHRDDQE